ncbi:MAG: ParB N-terminal domain-containing protein [Deltaproteobacteria bacterium]|jgi:hypothetical protein|nr:ParB N-terminal domain-containing protein [Deltaproteobacteria bacterium]
MNSTNKSKYEKFEIEAIERGQIHDAPYNPRTISENARKRLRKFLAKHGLVSPLTWNRRTGNLVSGHQRLAALDALEGRNNYTLNVAVIDVSEKEEKALNVQMNNPSMQGEWNVEALQEMVFGDEINPEDMGFSSADTALFFGDDERFAEMFPDTPDAEKAKEDIRKVKEHREEAAERMKEEQSADFYFVVLCRDEKQKAALMKRLETPAWEQHVIGDVLSAALGLNKM